MNADRSLLSSSAMIGADAALKRASLQARETARRTGTACWVLKDGRLVDIAKRAITSRRATRTVKRRKGS